MYGFESCELITISYYPLKAEVNVHLIELRDTNNYHCVLRFNVPSLYASHCYSNTT